MTDHGECVGMAEDALMRGQNEIGARVRRFYEESPFPEGPSEGVSSFSELEATAGGYARVLDKQLPSDARIIDIGCGTGQLLCFLGKRGQRRLVGVDFSLSSLRQGRRLADVIGLGNVSFVQADLFHLPFGAERYDCVLCHGVLHHTDEPGRGLTSVSGLLKRGGILSLGLYSAFGRLPHRLRMWMWRKGIFKRRPQPDRYYRDGGGEASAMTLQSWFHDQYEHPHEVAVSLRQARRWFDDAGLGLLRVLPGAFTSGLGPDVSIVPKRNTAAGFPGRFRGFMTQLGWLLHPRELGYFILIGTKRGAM